MPETAIHPSAIVEPGAVLGQGVRIGPFCHVGPEVVLGEGVVEEGEVGLVGVGGGAETGLEWGHATSVESLHLGRPADTEHKLCVEVALNVLLLFLHLGDVGALVVGSVVDDLELELVGCLCGLRAEGLEELRSVVSAAGLTCYLLVSNLIVRVMTKKSLPR